VRTQTLKTISAVGVASAINGEVSAGAGRSQEVIIVISDFVMESNLHETGQRFQFMKVNF
jgi:hypothetical protein